MHSYHSYIMMNEKMMHSYHSYIMMNEKMMHSYHSYIMMNTDIINSLKKLGKLNISPGENDAFLSLLHNDEYGYHQ